MKDLRHSVASGKVYEFFRGVRTSRPLTCPETDGETKRKKRESRESEQMFEEMLRLGSELLPALAGPPQPARHFLVVDIRRVLVRNSGAT